MTDTTSALEEKSESVVATAIALDQPRILDLNVGGGRIVSYIFRRILEADWKRFFEGILSQVETKGAQRIETFDYQSPLIELVESCLDDVGGYAFRDPRPAKWKQLLPYKHKLGIGSLLRQITISKPKTTDEVEEFVISEFSEVSLDAIWGVDEQSVMVEYRGLIHRFNPPTIAQVRQYNRESARTLVVGTSKGGKTIYPSRTPTMIRLYNELIAEVDGYTVSGQPLEGVESIRAWMDAAHKVAAIGELFSAAQSADTPEE